MPNGTICVQRGAGVGQAQLNTACLANISQRGVGVGQAPFCNEALPHKINLKVGSFSKVSHGFCGSENLSDIARSHLQI